MSDLIGKPWKDKGFWAGVATLAAGVFAGVFGLEHDTVAQSTELVVTSAVTIVGAIVSLVHAWQRRDRR